MYPRDIRVNDPSEALIVEQALAMYREMKEAADVAPTGPCSTWPVLAVVRDESFTRKSLEVVLQDQAEAVEKKGLLAEPARVAARDTIGAAVAQGHLGGGSGDAAATFISCVAVVASVSILWTSVGGLRDR